MKMLRQFGLAACAVALLATSAWAIQPGTTGTNKLMEGLAAKIGVLECIARTATASAGAATINAATNSPSACGTVTSESLTTLAGSEYTLTLTNNLIGATDIVLATVANGTNTGGELEVKRITPAAGSVAIVVKNDVGGPIGTPSSLNGTIKINFFVIKQNALGND